jgi:hypothetical protein
MEVNEKEESLQDLTEYTPTPAEAKLLEVLSNPENRFKNISDICKIAEISRPTYYSAFEKPGFLREQRKRAQQMFKQYEMPVISAFIREATRGSYPHGKVVLEILGLYKEESNVNTKVTGEVVNTYEHKLELEGQLKDDPESRELLKQLYRRRRELESTSKD